MSGKERMQKSLPSLGLLTEHDIYLLKEGSHFKLHEKLGAHLIQSEGMRGVYFAVWAPNAESVSVVGDFNGWKGTSHPLRVREDGSGVWEGFFSDIGVGALYKYHLVSRNHQYTVEKSDPFAFCTEIPPRTASVVWDLQHQWSDQAWMAQRAQRNQMTAPISIYEMHLGSWRRVPEEGDRPMTYREMAKPLTEYLQEMKFTHIELMPVSEHPFAGSWGYQVTGYFAPDQPLGQPRGFLPWSWSTRCHADRHRRLHRLGARPLPERRSRARPLRRQRTLRTRGPAPGRAPRVGHADLQLRAQRGEELPALQRAFLARGLPRRRAARRRGGLDALSRLSGRAPGDWYPQPPRRQGKPRGHRLPARAERSWCTAATPAR
ncbi:MAG: hypothetical protein MPW15_23755 [Candidatus Manganitrophus sp.]|nr:hypothetical protein [Candidatus Manganitrophus sp.]